MKCPTCNNVNLLITERRGIEVDYCPVCRGAWLDRAELDKIIDRSISSIPSPATPMYASNSHRRPDYDEHCGEHDRNRLWSSGLFDWT